MCIIYMQGLPAPLVEKAFGDFKDNLQMKQRDQQACDAILQLIRVLSKYYSDPKEDKLRDKINNALTKVLGTTVKVRAIGRGEADGCVELLLEPNQDSMVSQVSNQRSNTSFYQVRFATRAHILFARIATACTSRTAHRWRNFSSSFVDSTYQPLE